VHAGVTQASRAARPTSCWPSGELLAGCHPVH
jgi:hypothetical protein